MVAKITVHTCAGGEISEVLCVMIEIAERYNCMVEADINGTPMVIGPDRTVDLLQLFELKRQKP